MGEPCACDICVASGVKAAESELLAVALTGLNTCAECRDELDADIVNTPVGAFHPWCAPTPAEWVPHVVSVGPSPHRPGELRSFLEVRCNVHGFLDRVSNASAADAVRREHVAEFGTAA